MGLFSNFNHSYDPWARSKLSRNDDYATAAFISISQNGQKIGSSNDDYPRYLNSEYRVHDPIKYHKNLISNGFLVEASAEVALKKLKVEQLKNILLQSGLSDKDNGMEISISSLTISQITCIGSDAKPFPFKAVSIVLNIPVLTVKLPEILSSVVLPEFNN